MLLMQKPKRTNQGKAITKHCPRGRPVLPRTVNVPGSVGAAAPSIPQQVGASTWAAQDSMGGQSATFSPLRAKALASQFLCHPQMWLQDMQMLCAAKTGALRDPRPTVISC